MDTNTYAGVSQNGVYNQYASTGYGFNQFWGVNGISTGDVLSFNTYNTGGGYAYGYQVYKNSLLNGERYEGVVGISGAEGNASKPVGYYGGWNYLF